MPGVGCILLGALLALSCSRTQSCRNSTTCTNGYCETKSSCTSSGRKRSIPQSGDPYESSEEELSMESPAIKCWGGFDLFLNDSPIITMDCFSEHSHCYKDVINGKANYGCSEEEDQNGNDCDFFDEGRDFKCVCNLIDFCNTVELGRDGKWENDGQDKEGKEGEGQNEEGADRAKPGKIGEEQAKETAANKSAGHDRQKQGNERSGDLEIVGKDGLREVDGGKGAADDAKQGRHGNGEDGSKTVGKQQDSGRDENERGKVETKGSRAAEEMENEGEGIKKGKVVKHAKLYRKAKGEDGEGGGQREWAGEKAKGAKDLQKKHGKEGNGAKRATRESGGKGGEKVEEERREGTNEAEGKKTEDPDGKGGEMQKGGGLQK